MSQPDVSDAAVQGGQGRTPGRRPRIWQQTTGRRAIWDDMEVHHRIPLEWAHLTPGSLNRLANLVGMKRPDHSQVSEAWRVWKVGLGGWQRSAADILRQAMAIDRQFASGMVFPK
ncbi:hypothetical protein [Kibdelosporangium aridum]|uniref:hypothetical protein n=1 Tax=Kibdelosporangium aridum TaxID=2030 RepID=UPI0035EF226A